MVEFCFFKSSGFVWKSAAHPRRLQCVPLEWSCPCRPWIGCHGLGFCLWDQNGIRMIIDDFWWSCIMLFFSEFIQGYAGYSCFIYRQRHPVGLSQARCTATSLCRASWCTSGAYAVGIPGVGVAAWNEVHVAYTSWQIASATGAWGPVVMVASHGLAKGILVAWPLSDWESSASCQSSFLEAIHYATLLQQPYLATPKWLVWTLRVCCLRKCQGPPRSTQTGHPSSTRYKRWCMNTQQVTEGYQEDAIFWEYLTATKEKESRIGWGKCRCKQQHHLHSLPGQSWHWCACECMLVVFLELSILVGGCVTLTQGLNLLPVTQRAWQLGCGTRPYQWLGWAFQVWHATNGQPTQLGPQRGSSRMLQWDCLQKLSSQCAHPAKWCDFLRTRSKMIKLWLEEL